MKNFVFFEKFIMRLERLTLSLLFALIGINSQAQVNVTGGYTATQLANFLTGTGVTVFGASLTCPAVAYGEFRVVSSTLGLDSGVVLTCGTAITAGGAIGVDGAASLFASTSLGTAGDPLLTALVGGTATWDACILEFDFKPAGDTVKFKYVFGSEEYTDYTCTAFNDVFGFFISGGAYGTPTNIAKVPGTNIPVCINSVNCGATGSGVLSTCTAMGAGSPFCAYYVNNSLGTTITYDGLTVPLTALAVVSPCDTYHLKLGVADASDHILDSGVFIAGGSLTSHSSSTVTATGTSGLPYCIRGCLPGNFVFRIDTTADTPVVIHYTISGSAVNGYDYATIPTSMTIPIGSDSTVLYINTLGVLPAGPKVITLTILVPDPCHPGVYTPGAVANLTILDSFQFRILTPDTLICNGKSVNIIALGDTAAAFTGILTYAWSPTGSLSSSTSLTPTATPTVTTTYTLTANAPSVLGCAPEQHSIKIRVYDRPILTTDSALIKTCDSIPVQMNVYAFPDTIPNTYEWTPVSYLSNTAISNPIVDPTVPGDYIYSVTVFPSALDSSCSSVLNIHVHVIPDYFSLNPDTVICIGQSVTMRATGSSEFSWLWTPSTGVSNTFIPNPVVIPVVTTDYFVTASYAHCPPITHNVNVTVVIPPPAGVQRDTICLGMNKYYDFTDTGAGYYKYLWTPGAFVSNDTLSNPIITPTDTGWHGYQITITPIPLATGCATIDSVYLLVSPTDFTLNNRDTEICIGSSITADISASDRFNIWTWTPVIGVTNTATMLPTFTPTATTNYTVTGSFWHCIASHNFKITVDTLARKIDYSDTICLGMSENIDLSFPGSGLYHYSWAPATFVSDPTSSNPTITPSDTGYYQWSIAVQPNAPNCAINDTVSILVTPNKIFISPHDTSICQNAPVQVRGNPYFLFTYQWVPTTGIGISNIINPLIMADTTMLYTVTAHFHLCPVMTDTIRIDVQPNPIVYMGGNRFVCQFDTLHLFAEVTPSWYNSYSYSWTPATSLDYSTLQNVVFSDNASEKVIVTVTTTAGCIGKDSAQVTVYLGNFLSSFPDLNFCPGDTAILNVGQSVGGVNYHWMPQMYVSDSNATFPVIRPITSGTYTVVGTNSFGCKDTASFNVYVHPAAMLLVGDSLTLYPGETYQINTQSNCSFFNWFPAYGLSNSTSSDPIASPDFSTKYIVTGKTEWGCVAQDSISIYVNPGALIDVPNAFTPGNGANNVLRIITRGNVSLNYFRIFNRWGEVIFETSDITQGWDGNFKGAPQPFGTYVYMIEAKTNISGTQKIIDKEGNVTLIR